MRRIFLLVLFAMLAVAGATAATPDASMYMRPGRYVDPGHLRLNMYCTGSGSPTVVFDSGLEDWAPAWVTIQPAISQITRTCTYDRAGNGLSAPGPMPRTTARIVDELHSLLHASGERGPYILVGHSFGGLNVRHYADRYSDDVAGLVLDDASAEDEVAYMTRKERLENDREIGKAKHELLHCMHLAQRHFTGATPKELHACPGQFFRGLPDPKAFSRDLNRTLIYEAEQPKQYAASASELDNFTTGAMEALMREHRSYGSIPVRILVATHHRGSTPHEERRWQLVHRNWLRLSSNSKYIAATKSGHYIQFDQPQLVIGAIRDEIRTVRSRHAR